MADGNSQAWSATESFDPMDPMEDFIDFNNLDIDFSIGYAHDAPGNSHDGQHQISAVSATLDVQQHLQSPAITQNHGNGPSNHHHNMSGHGMSQGSGVQSFFDFTVPQYNPEHGYRPHSGVPPTPNSVEMHGDPNRYLQQMDPQQAIFDQRYQVRKDDATFTPLVSPAVTPHDSRFQIPDFTVPGAYFSPLTSPALNAQNQQQTMPQQNNQYTTSGSSTGTSPVDVDMDILGEPAMAQPEQGRRLRSNKRNTPRSGNAANRVRQSPVVRPARRKATVQTLMPHPREVSELVEEARSNRLGASASANGLEVPGSLDSSETDSISPEPLSEMGPPPKPHSTTQSPAMMAQIQNGANRGTTGQAPATPSSLMRIQPSPTYGVPADVPPLLDDFSLPEASLDRPQVSRADTAIYNDDLDTPRLSARKTPKLNPLSTPSGASAMSGKPSPMLGPNSASTPTSPAFSMTNKKTNPKKRNSVSSNLVSPALRPKISPSIKPLLPDGGVGSTDNTHALLLASKSNYQNILDGTTVPGVVYPTSLSTNLTSKRTSHKIAEQGRRNRINTALQEMQALLPSPQLGAKDAKSPETSALQSNNSKAAKVESAIEYIKQLKQECSEKDQLLEQKDQEVEALRKELAALRRSSSVSDAPLKAEPASTPSSDNGT